MKSRRPISAAQILGLMTVSLTLPLVASAAPHAKKAVRKTSASAATRPSAREVYAATDDTEMQAGFAMPVETAPASAPAPAPKPARVVAAPVAAPIEKAAPRPKALAAAFDAVPASQADAIVQRLKIVENLVRKYGRAYDYRTHTLKEFQLIESTLESANAPAAHAPVPAAASRAAAPAAAAATNDTIRTGQAAAIENAEDVNLKSLPAPAEYEPNSGDEEI